MSISRCGEEILRSAESIPTLGTQLSIISSVKSATPQDRSVSCDVILSCYKIEGGDCSL